MFSQQYIPATLILFYSNIYSTVYSTRHSTGYIMLYSTVSSKVFRNNLLEAGREVFLRD